MKRAAYLGPHLQDEDGETTYQAFVGVDGTVGYRCEHNDGRATYVYLNASLGSDDGVATMFLYQDDLNFENPLHWYATWESQDGALK